MWQGTEVSRLEREVSTLTEDGLYSKFCTASRGDLRLACALLGYFRGDAASGQYLEYLSQRIRPAAMELIASNRPLELAQLEAQGLFTEALTEELLQAAIRGRHTETIASLLRLKEQKYGFRDRDLRWPDE